MILQILFDVCLFRYFAHLEKMGYSFLLLSFESSLYILDASSLSDIQWANIISMSLACLFILLIFQRAEVLNFDEVQFINLTFFWIVLRCAHPQQAVDSAF